MTIPTPMRERCANAARKYLERCADLGTPISYADLTDAVLAELETPTEEQDAAARREGFEQAREMAANVCGQPAEALLGMRLMGETTMGLFARVIRALTQEPPSEKP